MNTTINKLTNPNVRHLIKGVLLCEMLNKHLREKQKKMPLEMMYEIEIVSDDEIDEYKNLIS